MDVNSSLAHNFQTLSSGLIMHATVLDFDNIEGDSNTMLTGINKFDRVNYQDRSEFTLKQMRT